jgi:hypothetical protein
MSTVGNKMKKPMRILFLTSAHNSLSQRLWIGFMMAFSLAAVAMPSVTRAQAQAAALEPSNETKPGEVRIVSTEFRFSPATVLVAAGRMVTLVLDNSGAETEHGLFVPALGFRLQAKAGEIGEIFEKVHPEGATETLSNVQSTLVPAGGATMVEFKTQVPGTYILVDHSLGRLQKGAAGFLDVEGPPNPKVFQSIQQGSQDGGGTDRRRCWRLVHDAGRKV